MLPTAQIVLAAGRSRRMGRPKALLDFDGKTALRLVVEAAAGAGVEESVIVVGPEAAAGGGGLARDPYGVEDLPIAVRWVTNPDPASEQIVSLRLALEDLVDQGREGRGEEERSEEGGDGEADGGGGASRVRAFFFQPVDCPLVTARDYRLLLDALDGDPGATHVFYLSASGRRGHPVLCRGALAGELLAVGRGERGGRNIGAGGTARDVLEAHPAAYVLTENAGVIDDMDVPADYRRLLAAYRGRRAHRDRSS